MAKHLARFRERYSTVCLEQLGQFLSVIVVFLFDNDLSSVGGFCDNGAFSWLPKR